jgi:MtN3 and saliva related transmembrane protein
MPDAVWTGIGTFAALLTSLSFIPQVIKMWRSQSVADVSPVTFIQFALGAMLWIAYGIYRQDPVVIGANIVTLATLLVALILYYQHKLTPIQQFVLAAICGAQAAGADATIAVRNSTRGLLKAFDGTVVDLAPVAQEAVRGAIIGAKAAGIKPESVASAAAQGAIGAAQEIDVRIAQRVKDGCEEITSIEPSGGMT